MAGRLRSLGAALALILVSAAPPPVAFTQANPMAPALAALEAADARLQGMGWRLARGNAGFCPDSAPAVGLLLYDVGNFARSGDVRAALGIAGDYAVGAVAAGSPAARAGLAPGDEVLAIDGTALTRLPPALPGDTARIAALQARIDAALAARGTVTLTLPRGQVVLAGEPACRARFELVTGSPRASAGSVTVRMGEATMAEMPDEAEAAALVAHELAHVILRHADPGPDAVRVQEREADRLAPWLLANAGYPPEGAERLMLGWVRRHDGGLLRAPSHDGWRVRLAAVRAELAEIAARRQAGESGPLDWRARFLRRRA